MGYHSLYIYSYFFRVCLLAYQLAPRNGEEGLACIQLIFFYLLCGKLLVYLFGTTLDPCIEHLAGLFAQNRRSKAGYGSETKEVIKAEYQKRKKSINTGNLDLLSSWFKNFLIFDDKLELFIRTSGFGKRWRLKVINAN